VDLCVELFKHSYLAVFDFVLGRAGAEGGGEIVPEFEEAIVEHDEHATDVTRAGAVEEEGACGGVEVSGRWAVAIAVEEFHSDEGVEEVADRARVQGEFCAKVCAGEAAGAESCEEVEFDGGEEDFGGPEGEGGLEDRAVVEGGGLHGV